MKAHFLPNCYLKGFVDPASNVAGREPYLWVRNPLTGEWKNRAPHKVATLPDYYAITRPDGSKDQTREEGLMRIESVVAPILRRIPDADRLTDDDAATLVLFANSMYFRLPVVHEVAEQEVVLPQVRALLTANWQTYSSDPEAFRRSLEDCARDTGNADVLKLQAEDLDPARSQLQVNREFVIDRLFQAGRAFLEILARMRWRLLRPVEPQHLFITSDRPVFVVDPKASDAERHYLLSPGAMFSLPLTKEVLLLGDWGGPPGMTWANITTAGVRDLNRRCTGPDLALYAAEKNFLGYEDVIQMEQAHFQKQRL
jgi:hypothetical protein